MSGRWVPPAVCGSLAMKRSPSRTSSPYLSSRQAMSPLIEAMWIGSAWAACTTSRPPASMIAVEWSRRSLMLVEYAERISATKVSSVIERSALEMISRVTGSTVAGSAGPLRSFHGFHAFVPALESSRLAFLPGTCASTRIPSVRTVFPCFWIRMEFLWIRVVSKLALKPSSCLAPGSWSQGSGDSNPAAPEVRHRGPRQSIGCG